MKLKAYGEALQSVQDRLVGNLKAAQKRHHSTIKGDAAENGWHDVLANFLPGRYAVGTGQVYDSVGGCSEQQDLLIFDHHFGPTFVRESGIQLLPRESVFCGFECKQSLNKKNLEAAVNKCVSLRGLSAESTSVPTISGPLPSRDFPRIPYGILATRSDYADEAGILSALEKHIPGASSTGYLDFVCVAEVNSFFFSHKSGKWLKATNETHIPIFLLQLARTLQYLGNLPAINFASYIQGLGHEPVW